MNFIDLFAGLGGFHKALHELGHTCVFASELDINLRLQYQLNWGIEPQGDIRKIVASQIETIPEHDILCAGFPCQPFSKAGKQLGREDVVRGTLFDEIVKILSYRRPRYFILENVPFIAKHDNEETWQLMSRELSMLNYDVKYEIYSPHDFGIPQHRKRIFIVGSLIGLNNFDFERVNNLKKSAKDVFAFIDEAPINFKPLSAANKKCLDIWQRFINNIPSNIKLPGFPIWSMEFGATYPFDSVPPHRMTSAELSKYKGNFGVSLAGLSKKEQMALLPSYARVKKKFPKWKQSYIRQNREFYAEYKNLLQEIINELSQYTSQSWQKLEWNVGDGERNIYKYLLQFRASGIRVKQTNFFPSLVCTNTQIPIVGWQCRYITKEEGLKLQSLEGISLKNLNDNAAFKALGNAVNSTIVKMIAQTLLEEENPIQLPAQQQIAHAI